MQALPFSWVPRTFQVTKGISEFARCRVGLRSKDNVAAGALRILAGVQEKLLYS